MLFVADDRNVESSHLQRRRGRRALKVPSIAIDDYVKPGERVDIVKMDIQGAELLRWQASSACYEKIRSSNLFSSTGRMGSNAMDLLPRLLSIFLMRGVSDAAC